MVLDYSEHVMLKREKEMWGIRICCYNNWVWIRKPKNELYVCSIMQKHLALVTE